MVHRAPFVYQAGQIVGGQVINTGAPTAVQIVEVLANPNWSVSGSTSIVMNNAAGEGLYDLGYNLLAIHNGGSNRTGAITFLALNGTEVPVTRGGLYLRQANFVSSASGRTFVPLVVGDTLQLFVDRTSGGGGIRIAPNGVSIMLKRVQ